MRGKKGTAGSLTHEQVEDILAMKGTVNSVYITEKRRKGSKNKWRPDPDMDVYLRYYESNQNIEELNRQSPSWEWRVAKYFSIDPPGGVR